MKRFGTRSATGKMVKLKLPVDVESLLIEASNRSGRSRSFEAVIRLKDHLHRYPKFNRAGNIYGKSLVKYLTMRPSYLLQNVYQIFSITPPAVYLLVTTYVCRIIRKGK